MKRENYAIGLPSITAKNGLCENYFLGKMNRLKFDKNKATRATKVLELIHSDLMGPFQVQSLGGASYTLTFIDDYSRMVFVYFLRNKSDCFEKFKYFKAMVENEKNLKIKMLRFDNGG